MTTTHVGPEGLSNKPNSVARVGVYSFGEGSGFMASGFRQKKRPLKQSALEQRDSELGISDLGLSGLGFRV